MIVLSRLECYTNDDIAKERRITLFDASPGEVRADGKFKLVSPVTKRFCVEQRVICSSIVIGDGACDKMPTAIQREQLQGNPASWPPMCRIEHVCRQSPHVRPPRFRCILYR